MSVATSFHVFSKGGLMLYSSAKLEGSALNRLVAEHLLEERAGTSVFLFFFNLLISFLFLSLSLSSSPSLRRQRRVCVWCDQHEMESGQSQRNCLCGGLASHFAAASHRRFARPSLSTMFQRNRQKRRTSVQL